MSIARIYTRWPDVEGYCNQQSYAAGETVEVCCSGRVEQMSVTVRRVGGETVEVWQQTGIGVSDHPTPDDAWSQGCGWPVTFTIETQPDWRSGFYEIEFVAEGSTGPRAVSHAFFVLRAAAGQHGRMLLAVTTNTYNAYNQWGGRCAYSGATRLSFRRPTERGFHHRPDVAVDRLTNTATPSDPTHRALVQYQRDNDYPVLTGSSGWHNWERRFVRWAEQAGFELDFATNADLHFRPELLDNYDMLLSVGHDEYWSAGMRDTVDSWVERGGRWAIFSGNTCFWKVEFDDDGTTMVCDKRGHSMWSDPVLGRPESSTTGLTFTRGGYHRIGGAVAEGTGDYEIHQPDHWVFAGTGLRKGDRLGTGSFIVGYEVDGAEPGAPIDVLATAPARLMSITDEVCEAPVDLWASVEPPGDLEGVAWVLFGDMSAESVAKIAHGQAVMAHFTKGKGEVFNAGTCDWSYGLDNDPQVQQVTLNVLRWRD